MWTNWNAQLGRHQVNSKDLVETRHTRRINLAKLHSPRHQELLEHHPVLTAFTGGHPDTKIFDSLLFAQSNLFFFLFFLLPPLK